MAELTAEKSFVASTKELKALLKNYDNLETAMTDPGPKSLALRLISHGLISESTLHNINVHGTTPATQAYYLLSDLKCSVVSNSENFHLLIQILSDASPALNAVAKLMMKDYGKLQFTCNILHLF